MSQEEPEPRGLPSLSKQRLERLGREQKEERLEPEFTAGLLLESR